MSMYGHPTISKPRILRARVLGDVKAWLCKGMGAGAYGDTPGEAYALWKTRITRKERHDRQLSHLMVAQ